MFVESVIAIDGPSGSGKSTLAKKLADALNLLYIDTGSMFRGLAFKAHQKGIPFEESAELREFLQTLRLDYTYNSSVNLRVDGEDVTAVIREHHVSKLASIASQLPSVRKFLLDYQRSLAKEKVCVMEGRDIGTVVFPKAFCKFFISASVEERARRRWDQLQAQSEGPVPELEQVKLDVKKRDESDMNRSEAPLKQAIDAIYIDSSELDLDQVLALLERTARERAQNTGVSLT